MNILHSSEYAKLAAHTLELSDHERVHVESMQDWLPVQSKQFDAVVYGLLAVTAAIRELKEDLMQK